MNRKTSMPEPWHVAQSGGTLVLTDAGGGLVLDPSDPMQHAAMLSRVAVLPALEHLVEVLSARLLAHEKAQPQYAIKDRKLVSAAWATLALGRPGEKALASLVQSTTREVA